MLLSVENGRFWINECDAGIGSFTVLKSFYFCNNCLEIRGLFGLENGYEGSIMRLKTGTYFVEQTEKS